MPNSTGGEKERQEMRGREEAKTKTKKRAVFIANERLAHGDTTTRKTRATSKNDDTPMYTVRTLLRKQYKKYDASTAHGLDDFTFPRVFGWIEGGLF